MNKKAIAILGAIFLLIAGTLGFLIFSKYGKKDAANPPVTQNNPAPNQPVVPIDTGIPSTTPDVSGSGPVKFSDEQVVSPVLYYNGQGVTYFNKEGQLAQVDWDESGGSVVASRKRILDIPVKANITKAYWPLKGDNFIVETAGLSGQKTWSFFDSGKGEYADFLPQVFSFDWMPDGERILYVWLENNKANMTLGKPDMTEWVTVSEMWETDDQLKVAPDGKNVAYFQTNNPQDVNFINQTTPDAKIWKGLVKDGYNLGVLWSPDSQKFLFGKKDPKSQRTQLWVYDLLSAEAKDTGLYTIVEKAAWDKSGNSFYAAVPVSGTASEQSLTDDTFYKVRLDTLEKTEFRASGPATDGRNLFLNLEGSRLFFKNAQDGYLYYLNLNQ
jgi:hypothetical protein